jgi:sortase A
MHGLGSAGQTGRGSMPQVLIWGGVLLFLVGGFLLYPYVSSRLVAFPSTTPAIAPSSPPPTATRPPATSTPTPAVSLVPTSIRTLPLPPPPPPPAIPDRIVIPAIDLDAPVVPVSQTVVIVDGQERPTFVIPATRAVGWHETSAPLGVPGNTVLNGHNTTHGEVFRDLYKLEMGDEIIVYSGEAAYTYTVTEMLVLPEAGQPLEMRIENARHIQPTEDERLTLVTCHPYGSLRNRLIVVACPAKRSVSTSDYPER